MEQTHSQPLCEELHVAPAPFVVVTNGPSAGQRVALGPRLIMGRSSRCDLTLPCNLVSRTHAELVRSGDGYILRDLGSVNGTFLNGRLITTAHVKDGDRVGLGDATLQVHLTAGDGEHIMVCSDVVLCSTAPDSGPSRRVPGAPAALQASLLSADPDRAQRARARLDALVSVTQTLTRLREREAVYPLVLDEVIEVLGAERGVLLLRDEDGAMQPKLARNYSQPGARVEVSRTIVFDVMSHRQCVLSADARLDTRLSAAESLVLHDIRSVLCVPICFEEELLGLVYMDCPGRERVFNEEDLHFVSGIAGIAAVAITNAEAHERVRAAHQELHRAYLATLAVLANAIEARDHYTIGHTWRVARFAQVIARQLGWDEEKISEIEVGGILHDIGKIGVPDSILTKSGPLDPDEQATMELHPEIGARMLADAPNLGHILPYVLHHHERWDGKGYPKRLAGEQTPPEARLLAVADALDAMTSDRPYRRGCSRDDAVAEIEREAGAQFDPEVVKALSRAYTAGELNPYLQAGLHDSHDIICPCCNTSCTPDEQALAAGETRCPTCRRMLVLHQAEGRVHAEPA